MSELTPITGHRARAVPGGRQACWSLPETLEVEPLVADLGKAFKLRHEKGRSAVRQWFDSDDWRLYRKKMLLFYEQDAWRLVHSDSGEKIAAFSCDKCETFRFPRDFPVSTIRANIEPVLSIRTLLPFTTHEVTSSWARILNRDRKTVAMVYFDAYVARETGDLFRSVTLKGVRGYDASFSEVKKFFETCGIRHEAAASAPFVSGVKSLGRSPLDYDSKFKVRLLPDMTASQAMKKIYRLLLESMEHNEQGIIDDLDTEFLHDFRVSVRRTRSGIAQVKGVLPPEISQKVKEDFSWLGNITGETRDLDVYLLDREKCMSRLPDNLRPNLEHFFVDIAGKRKREQKKLAGDLRSLKYRRIINFWHEYLEGEDAVSASEHAGWRATDLSREIIFSRYNKVMKKGEAISRSSPDEDLHRLRIHCKKLRYIMEFFASLFSAGEMKRAIKQLKRLQDNLGLFNDLSVQQDMLRNYLADLRPGSRKNQELASAIGGLLANLHQEQLRVRKEFSERFHRFSCKKNQELYTKLFR